jgi:hypothetical protein
MRIYTCTKRLIPKMKRRVTGNKPLQFLNCLPNGSILLIMTLDDKTKNILKGILPKMRLTYPYAGSNISNTAYSSPRLGLKAAWQIAHA